MLTWSQGRNKPECELQEAVPCKENRLPKHSEVVQTVTLFVADTMFKHLTWYLYLGQHQAEVSLEHLANTSTLWPINQINPSGKENPDKKSNWQLLPHSCFPFSRNSKKRQLKHSGVLNIPQYYLSWKILCSSKRTQAQRETGTIKQTKWTFFREKWMLYQLWYWTKFHAAERKNRNKKKWHLANHFFPLKARKVPGIHCISQVRQYGRWGVCTGKWELLRAKNSEVVRVERSKHLWEGDGKWKTERWKGKGRIKWGRKENNKDVRERERRKGRGAVCL